LARNAPGERPWLLRLVALACGGATFGLLVPWLLVAGARQVTFRLGAARPPLVVTVVAWCAVAVGLVLALWTVTVQVTFGRGTPVPLVPTQRLLTHGPYRLCRNPMVLGALTANLGLMVACTSVAGALLVWVPVVGLAVAYHKLVEERELALRFGEEYLAYQARTPFLVPALRRPRE
jgi:protein-S-isoprenylcysteine O-methyltransferase Ste14